MLIEEPFPHIVMDDYYHPTFIEGILSDFPEPNSGWWQYNNPLERKWAKNRDLPNSIRRFISMLQSYEFVSEIENLMGIPHLITDHTLNGGGLHQISRGGKLDIHEDYNYHPLTALDRRVNLLLYLNRDWKPEWGGNLELWDQNMTQCVKSYEPIFNRMVIFQTVPQAYHGHPDPLLCPEGVTRKSIAMYYYTNGRPLHEVRPKHSTLFQRRPQDPIDPELDALREKRSKGRV